jgi:hypothetical protein
MYKKGRIIEAKPEKARKVRIKVMPTVEVLRFEVPSSKSPMW